MPKFTRKQILAAAIGTSLLLFVGGALTLLGMDEDWNEGREPWKEHPNKNTVFDPDYTMLLYIDVQRVPASGTDTKTNRLQMHVVRLQFPAQRQVDQQTGKTINTWHSNSQRILEKISFLNGDGVPVPCTDPKTCGDRELYVNTGVAGFKFNQQHHFVIYVRNAGVEFNEKYPIWFGGELVGSIENNGGQKGADNWSFYGATVQKGLNFGQNFSSQLIYVKNYYSVRGFLGLSHKDIDEEKEFYSLNINSIVKSPGMGGAGTNVPLIIDPDTGNMGGGDPPKD